MSESIAATPGYLDDAARAAPGDLPTDIGEVADLIRLYGQARDLGADTADLSGRFGVAVRRVQATCADQGTTVGLLDTELS